MNLLDRIALFLWRDRGSYDPVAETMPEDYNRSLLTRYRAWRYHNRGAGRRFVAWIGPTAITATATLGAVLLAQHFNAREPGEQLDTNAGKLILSCAQQADDVYVCRKVRDAQDQVVAGADGAGVDVDVPTQEAAGE